MASASFKHVVRGIFGFANCSTHLHPFAHAMWFISCGESLGESGESFRELQPPCACKERQPRDMGSKLTRITFVPHKSRSSKKRSRICLKKMYLRKGRHAGPVWILVSPRQMHDWARQVQSIPSPKSLTPRFVGVK